MSRRILIVDDHRLFQQGLRLVLEQQPGWSVAAEAQTGAQALALAGREAFDFVLLDVHLPDADGIDLVRQMLERRPETRIVILSSDANPRRIDEALRAGALGYVLKVNAAEDLHRALSAAAEGRRYLSAEANAALLSGYAQPPSAPLSPRERDVLRLIATGARTKEIAAALGIGVKSAETYRSRLMRKLGLYSVAELTRHAVREGLASE